MEGWEETKRWGLMERRKRMKRMGGWEEMEENRISSNDNISPPLPSSLDADQFLSRSNSSGCGGGTSALNVLCLLNQSNLGGNYNNG